MLTAKRSVYSTIFVTTTQVLTTAVTHYPSTTYWPPSATVLHSLSHVLISAISQGNSLSKCFTTFATVLQPGGHLYQPYLMSHNQPTQAEIYNLPQRTQGNSLNQKGRTLTVIGKCDDSHPQATSLVWEEACRERVEEVR